MILKDSQPIMKTTLSAVWSQIKELIDNGYSLIPVHDEGPDVKRPFLKWEAYKDKIIDPSELWAQMEKFNTTAVAMLTGRVSGNAEVIDIDVKWEAGIDGLLFKTIQDLFPDIWQRLRIHKTPTGGYHILYRIIDQPPSRSQKIAKRLLSDEERVGWDRTNKQVCFIETRGEGGYAVIPPSLGYSIWKAEPIPLLTIQERNALMAVCLGFNKVIKIDKPAPLRTKRESEYYDESPFEHFNRSEEGRNVLLEFGWKYLEENSTFCWFNRPGSKSNERHGAFIKSKQLFYFWSTNTEFEDQRCYQPSTILAVLGYDKDFKATYRELVKRGFGRIRKDREERIIQYAKKVPGNLSLEGRAAKEAIELNRSTLHPSGIFWEISEEGKCGIDREGLYKVSGRLGFRYYEKNDSIVRINDGKFLEEISERTYFDVVKSYIKEPDSENLNLIINTYEHFLQVAGAFTITRLPLLNEDEVFSDTVDRCYKFFSDTWIEISSEEITQHNYESLNGYVWKNRLLNRNFILGEGGRYIDFLEKAIGINDHLLKIIGYLSHEYKDETIAYILVLTESCPDPKMGGGSGKNLFCSLFHNVTTVASRPGEQITYDERFFQSWNGEKIFVISDAPKDFKFMFLKEITSGSAALKKLFKNISEVKVGDVPKIIVNTNYSYDVADGGLKRRIIPLEFTDFFTRCGGVKLYYGGIHFTKGWDDDDWAGYNTIVIKGIQEWLKSGMVLEHPSLTEGGWRKQFEQTHGFYASDFVYENWETWTTQGFVDSQAFRQQMSDYFNEKNIPKMYQPSIHRIHSAITEYSERMEWHLDLDTQKKMGGQNVKGKSWWKDDAPF